MIFQDHITTTPLPYDLERARETVAALNLSSGHIYDLILGTAGSSPYLRGLIAKEHEWIHTLWDRNPWDVFQTCLDGIDPKNLETSLRQAKRRIALLTALSDLSGVWPLEDVTKALTLFADYAVHITLKTLVAADIERGKIPQTNDPESCAGIFVLAMGKMGAFELNYSSDIDLICFFDDARYADDDIGELRPHLIKIIQRMCKILSDVTRDGYVFRTDLRLRPNPSVTPVCVSTTAAMQYYETEGRTWERAAFIKARSCAGDIAAGEQFLKDLKPFIWRKHLDFAAIEDAHDMRLRIRAHKKLHSEITIAGHNMKLGRGGIREIEFFAQTRQMIAGGRDNKLRDRGTLISLQDLVNSKWIEQPICDTLQDAYRKHRTHEHRIQMIGDIQTHDLPTSSDDMDRFARLCGSEDTKTVFDDIQSDLQTVHNIIEEFFAPDQKQAYTIDDFEESFTQWQSLPAFRSPRAVDIFERLKPRISQGLSNSKHPQEALRDFETFISGLPTGVQLFSLFDSNPKILDLVLDVVSTAPSLATYLARNSSVLDAVIAGTFFEPLPNKEALIIDFHKTLTDLTDYEDQLNMARRWFKEHHFRIGVLQLRNIADAFEASQAYSELAQACLAGLLPYVERDFARKHGVIDGGGLAILAMGKLGSCEMTATSDLDLIVIYDPANQDSSDGKRPLAPAQYYARLTQALVTALTSPTGEGKLYEVDMRLRPSGRKGPVATSVKGFENYQRNEAWTWEHLALTRASVVAGSEAVIKQVADIRESIVQSDHDRTKVLADVADMRKKLGETKSKDKSIWEVKEVKGGLLDIELLAQACALIGNIVENDPKGQLVLAAEAGVLPSDDALTLIETHSLLSQVQHISRLLVTGSFDVNTLSQAGLDHILSVTGYDDNATLEAAMMSKTRDAEQVILQYLS
ncbi:glutamine-synthetase adenylyltransferase [Amylibacter sp. SFDW26]|uniref:[protein-PII] uridylyltransferase family protein n=1 Tax=Amylibacter sp. SFDW26 TaxID=2652722 RepID=UPI0012628063|nr:glutamine-synthetase adenylyltransferase [Amylibacter sp. SFDW26]KAB7615887.1 glutamine-synthetase adenylyltransferase [Amylibacter sp. SFDW26]